MAQRLPTIPGQCDETSTTRRPGSITHTSQGSEVDNSDDVTHQSLVTPHPDGAESPTDDNDRQEELFECAICLQTCIHPVKLPCTHIFCFLCVKGVAIQSKRCALCRQDIPVDYFNNPSLLRKEDLLKESAFEGGYQWYYQGNNGWWQYDERASSEIEKQFKEGTVKQFEVLIAGFLYIIDYENMLQFRRNDPSRRRKIKRDLITIPDKKGVAGLKVVSRDVELASPVRPQGDGGENIPCVVQQAKRPGASQTRPRPANTRQTAQVPSGALSASPQAPHNTPEEPAQREQQELRGTDTANRGSGQRSKSRPSQNTGPRRQQPAIPEQATANTDTLSSHLSNLSLDETPRARNSQRNRLPRQQPHSNEGSSSNTPEEQGGKE